MDDIIRRLRSQDLPFNDGLTDLQLRAFERRMGCALPPELRALYHDHDGVERGAGRSFHLMPHEEAIEFNAMKEQNSIAFCGEDIFDVESDDPARIFWTDFNSNNAGVFVSGPNIGCVFVFDHDLLTVHGSDYRLTPRYRSVGSFLSALAGAVHIRQFWNELPTDYPDEQRRIMNSGHGGGGFRRSSAKPQAEEQFQLTLRQWL